MTRNRFSLSSFIAPEIEPLLKQYKVDLALFGHLHNYERSYPVFNGTVSAQSYDDPEATVHMVNGMPGDDEGLTPGFSSPSPAWSAKCDARLGYARIHFDETSLHLQYVLAEDGSIADSFTIERSASRRRSD